MSRVRDGIATVLRPLCGCRFPRRPGDVYHPRAGTHSRASPDAGRGLEGLERMPEDELDKEIDDEADVPEDLDEEDLEVLDDDDEVVDDTVVDDEELDPVEPIVDVKPVPRDDDDDDDEEDEDDSDDVEASLDVILKERMVVTDDEDDEDEATDGEDRGDSPLKVLPKQPGEFVCQSCFLVKHPSQLADRDRMYCRDCV